MSGSASVAQRVIVRMLHDPVFRAAVFAEPERVLAAEGVSPELAASIVGHDARAFGVDAFRGHRVVRAMLDEVAVTALALAQVGVTVQSHMAFLQSAWFHKAIMERGRLSDAFVGYLGEGVEEARRAAVGRRARGAVGTAAAMLALEAAFGRARRRRDVEGCGCQEGSAQAACGGAKRIAAGRVVGVEVPAGTLAAWEKARRALGEGAIEAVLTGRALPAVGAVGNSGDGGATESVLIELDALSHEPLASFSGAALVGLVKRVEHGPVEPAVLVAMVMDEGADEAEANEIIGELLADGVLVHVR